MIALKQILVATDFSEASDAALLYGRQLARAHGATLHLLHIVGNVASEMASPVGIGPNSGHLQMELEADAQRQLEALAAADERGGVRARAVALSSGSIAQAILTYADTEQIDLIIVGTHGRTGFAHFFMGSVAQHVVRRAPCPVLTVRHPEREFVVPETLAVAVAS
jgi:nucleotide-binding universal stress UspA family protein